MRPSQNNKRMRSRNNNNNSNNNRKGPNPLSRTYESNGPDVKIRGTAHHVGEKYLQLARDAQSSGDPVMAESYLQHAEHYFRLIAAAQQAQQQQFAGYNRPAGEPEAEDLEEEDDFNGLNDRFASPAERAPQNQPQPYPTTQAPAPNAQPAYNNAQSSYQERPSNYQERPQYEPRGDRNNRHFQDRNQDRNQERGTYAERNGQGNRDNSPRDNGPRDGGNGRPRPPLRTENAPRYDNTRYEPRGVSDEAGGAALPAFITAPVPVRTQPEADLPVDDAVGTEVLARPEAEGEAGFALRPRRRRRKEFGEAENKAPLEE